MKRRLDSSMAAPQQAARPLLASVLPRRLAALQLLLQPAVDQGLLVTQRVVGIPVRTEHECRIHERAPPFLDDLAVVRREPEVEIDAWRIDVLHDPRIAGGSGIHARCEPVSRRPAALREGPDRPLAGAGAEGPLASAARRMQGAGAPLAASRPWMNPDAASCRAPRRRRPMAQPPTPHRRPRYPTPLPRVLGASISSRSR